MRTISLILGIGFSLSAQAQSGAAVKLQLSPAGSFTLDAPKVTGEAYKTADGIVAENVVVDLTTVKTGIGLRDKHTKDKLEVDKFPHAKLIKATGKNGKGRAKIEVHGKTQDVEGTYKIVGNMLHAEFPVHLTNFDIKNIRYMSVGVKDQAMVSVKIPLKAGPDRKAASVKGK